MSNRDAWLLVAFLAVIGALMIFAFGVAFYGW